MTVGTVVDIVTSLGALLALPADVLPGGLGLTVIAVVTGVLALYAVRFTTDQKKLEQERDRVLASIYEMRLFIDEPRRVLAAQVHLLKWSMRYTLRTIPALLVIGPPLALAYPQLEIRFGMDPFSPGDRALVRVEGTDPSVRGATLSVTEGAKVDTPSVWIDDEQRLYYRVEVLQPGLHTLSVDLNGAQIEKQLVAQAGAVAPERVQGVAGLWAFSNEPALADDGLIRRISIDYPASERSFLGMPWWGYWLLVSMIAAFALRRPLKVVI